MESTKKNVLVCVAALSFGAALLGCGSDSKSDSDIPPAVGGVGGTSSNGGSGGSTGGAGGSTGGSAGSTSSQGGQGGTGTGGSTGGTAGTGGSGGSSEGGAAGTGGSGGAVPGACLDPSTYSAALTTSPGLPFCVIGAYSTDRSVQSAGPSWGSHGGPLTATSASGSVSLCRWQLPSGATGAATCEQHDATPPNLPAMIYFGPAVDVPFLGGTLLSYTGTGTAMEAPGEVLLYSTTLDKLNDRANVNGFFSAVALSNTTLSRLVYTGLSPIMAAPATTNDSGLYVAQDCSGKLAPSGACPTAKKVATWQTNSGPVAADIEGAVFATLSTFMGAQEIHGFGKELLLTSDTPGNGDLLLMDMNYTTSLAAIAPKATKEEGFVFVAESDPTTFAPLPIVAVKYASSSDHTTAGAVIKNALTIVPPMGAPSLFSDADGHLWIAVDTSATAGMLLELKHK